MYGDFCRRSTRIFLSGSFRAYLRAVLFIRTLFRIETTPYMRLLACSAVDNSNYLCDVLLAVVVLQSGSLDQGSVFSELRLREEYGFICDSLV